MINDKELLISNKSYINKDFASIYPELIDIVKSLTDKWDPETSNESDPGVVLLKVLAFMGDKLNYNIDKNVLECFMPSATQESSMRKLCDMMGYNMRYYVSAETKISFSYTGTTITDDFTLNAFDTVVTSNDKSIDFVLTNSVTIKPNAAQAFEVNAIQGKLNQLIFGGSSLIQLDNIDENRRVYFPVINVAQNGVFINRETYDPVGNPTAWHRVDNLNLVKTNEKCYKFGFDSSRGLPYIEFPEYISNIIGEGLNIEYITTSGKDGNVKAKFLTTLASANEITVDGQRYSLAEDTDLIIINQSASINGADPETINDAYNSFKKTIGTFDTLVTCRDYANFIYNLQEDIYPYVSNVQVADRRDDLNYSGRILTFDTTGIRMINEQRTNKSINAFDLCLYPLNPITTYNLNNFLNSFKPLSGLKVSDIKDILEESKSISHNYKELDSADIYAIKNYYLLNAKISTTHKVNEYERAEIVSNVKMALIQNFNARKIDYGYEIPYETLYNVIKNADSRISNLSLDEPSIKTYFMLENGEESPVDVTSATNKIFDILALNILQGRISLFKKDDRFSFEFGQGGGQIVDNITHISTLFKIEIDESEYSVEKTLKKNEALQFIGPSLITKISYTYGIYYLLDSNSGIPGGNYKKLGGNEYLYLVYADSDTGEEISVMYKENDIIHPTGFDMPANPTSGALVTKWYKDHNGNRVQGQFLMLGAKETIDIVELNENKLLSDTYCYWIRNNSSNSLFNSNEAISDGFRTILEDGEYFFYTDASFTSLVSLGSGTTITVKGPSMVSRDWSLLPKISYSDLSEKGLLELKDKWTIVKCNASDSTHQENSISLLENEIITLTENDHFEITDASGMDSYTITNEPQPLAGAEVTYTFFGEEGEKHLDKLDLDEYNANYQWKVRSRLDLDVGPKNPQYLNKDHYIYVYNTTTYSTNPLELEYDEIGIYFQTNQDVSKPGSNYIDLSSWDLISSTYYYPISLYNYDNEDIGYSIIKRDADGYARIYLDYHSEGQDPDNSFVEYEIPAFLDKDTVVMFYWDSDIPDDDNKYDIGVTGSNITFSDYNEGGSAGSGAKHYSKGIHVLHLRKHSAGLGCTLKFSTTLNFPTTSLSLEAMGTLIIGSLWVVDDGFNPDLGLPVASEGYLLEAIHAIDSGRNFYYNNPIDNSRAIESGDLTDPLSFYDKNNVVNKFVISEVVVNTSSDSSSAELVSSIDVVRSSRL